MVVWRWLPLERTCAAIRSPFINTSTVRGVSRTSTSRRGEAVGNAVEVSLDQDVVIDADAAQPPFGKGVGLARQLLEVRPIEFLEEGSAGDAEPTDRPHLKLGPQTDVKKSDTLS
jgi:hypothetical protein